MKIPTVKMNEINDLNFILPFLTCLLSVFNTFYVYVKNETKASLNKKRVFKRGLAIIAYAIFAHTLLKIFFSLKFCSFYYKHFFVVKNSNQHCCIFCFKSRFPRNSKMAIFRCENAAIWILSSKST